MRRLYSLELQGTRKHWGINVWADPSWVEDWRRDGLEVNEILNWCPEWVPWWAIRPWFFLQDVWNFKNPWSER